jgi:hypothetical protein
MIHENKAGEVIAIEGASNISRGKTGEITLYRTYTSGFQSPLNFHHLQTGSNKTF